MTNRLQVDYLLTCREGESPRDKARGIALEQTVELAAGQVSKAILDKIVGRIERLEPIAPGRYDTCISYSTDTVGNDLPQLLNLLFGNISLKDGILIRDIRWPSSLLEAFGGPGFGAAGIRSAVNAHQGPLLCTALKPMGSSPAELAAACEAFARGGIDIIKDDHGLADQPPAPFNERVARCQEALERGNAATGRSSRYFPNVTAPAHRLAERLEIARAAGCQGVLISPWLVGLDTMRWARDEFGLILMAHPALTGSYFRETHGIAAEVLLGDLFRIAGADASIYPNTGGRFGFTQRTCDEINRHLRQPLGSLRPALPVPGGGMDVARAPAWVKRYGTDTILLIGGSLYQQGDLARASEQLRRAVDGQS